MGKREGAGGTAAAWGRRKTMLGLCSLCTWLKCGQHEVTGIREACTGGQYREQLWVENLHGSGRREARGRRARGG